MNSETWGSEFPKIEQRKKTSQTKSRNPKFWDRRENLQTQDFEVPKIKKKKTDNKKKEGKHEQNKTKGEQKGTRILLAKTKGWVCKA